MTFDTRPQDSKPRPSVLDTLQNATPYDHDMLDMANVWRALNDGPDAIGELGAPVYLSHPFGVRSHIETMDEWGEQLPHGVEIDGEVRRDFELKRQTARLDIEVQKVLTGAAMKRHQGRAMAALVAINCEHIAGVKLGNAAAKSVDFCMNLAATDLLYILSWRGFQRSNRKLPLLVDPMHECPNCGKLLRRDIEVGLGAMRIHVIDWEPGAPPVAGVKLVEPLRVGDRTVIDAVAVATVTWGCGIGAARTSDEMANDAWVRQKTLEGIIVGHRTVEGECIQGAVPPSALLDLTSMDADSIFAASTHTVGDVFPYASGRHDCGEVIPVPFDWRSLAWKR